MIVKLPVNSDILYEERGVALGKMIDRNTSIMYNYEIMKVYPLKGS